jgi:hypothetical protein
VAADDVPPPAPSWLRRSWARLRGRLAATPAAPELPASSSTAAAPGHAAGPIDQALLATFVERIEQLERTERLEQREPPEPTKPPGPTDPHAAKPEAIDDVVAALAAAPDVTRRALAARALHALLPPVERAVSSASTSALAAAATTTTTAPTTTTTTTTSAAPASAAWAAVAVALVDELLERCTIESALRLLDDVVTAPVAAAVLGRLPGAVGLLGPSRLARLLRADEPHRRAVACAAVVGDAAAVRRDLPTALLLAESEYPEVRAAIVAALEGASPTSWSAARVALVLDATAGDVRDAGRRIVERVLREAPQVLDVDELGVRLAGHADPAVRRLVFALRDASRGRGGEVDDRRGVPALARTVRVALFAGSDVDVALKTLVQSVAAPGATAGDVARTHALLVEARELGVAGPVVDAAVARVRAAHPEVETPARSAP